MKCSTCGERERIKNRKCCYTCRYAKLKQKNPISLAYQQLKQNAKHRGKDFQLTLEEFKEFCIQSNYLNKRGIKHDSYHIDRKDETKGYIIDNIQLLTNVDNVRKYIEFRGFNSKNAKVFKTEKELDLSKIKIEKETPF